MRLSGAALSTAALAAVLLLWSRSANASAVADTSIDPAIVPSDAPEFDGPVTDAEPDLSMVDWLDIPGPVSMVDDMATNLAAFLYMIRNCEHRADDVRALGDYGTFFGGSRFYNFSDHPVLTGEKKGVPLKPEWCRRAGFASGVCVSTAAGAYQFTVRTWQDMRRSGPWGPRLPDFTPASQDTAAARLLGTLGVPELLAAGQLDQAVRVASQRWASLPGSTSGQPQKSLAFAMAKFDEGLRLA